MRLLFEIGMEEIPARFLQNALDDLKKNLSKKFQEDRIKFGEIKTFGTPRRMVLLVEGIASEQEDLDVVNLGPAKSVAFDQNGELSRAGMGFLKSQNVSLENIEIIITDKGEYIGVKKFLKGGETTKLFPEILKSLVSELTFPKSMKWADKEFRFARPLQWFLALIENEVIPFELEGLSSGNTSRGHRFFGENFSVNSIDEYFLKIRENNVIIDISERKELIKKLINEKLTDNERVEIDEELLNEVSNLVEYPYPIIGTFNSDFLEVPQDVLIISMKVHQRYFPILDKEGKLKPKFIVIRNGIEDSNYVRIGNEKVISARLSDARFFYNEDLKRPFEDNVEKLKTVVYQKDLGTIYDKIERIRKIADEIIKECNLDDKRGNIERVITLCKADLVSNMIGEKEFTKLQGFMGADYALKNGEKQEVAKGIEEHYYPRFQGDILPSGIEGIVVGISDRIDTLVGCFSVGMIPTGSKDPFALRRATLGIVNIILNSNLDISLDKLISLTLEILESKNILKKDKREIKDEINEFIKQRIVNIFTDFGYERDILSAILIDNTLTLFEIKMRLDSIVEFKKDKSYNTLINSVKRVTNISKEATSNILDSALFHLPCENMLKSAVDDFVKNGEILIREREFSKYLHLIIELSPVIENYFNEVMIMDKDEEIKKNRLSQIKILDEILNRHMNLKELDTL